MNARWSQNHEAPEGARMTQNAQTPAHTRSKLRGPPVSVVIPTYRRHQYLTEALLSIAEQTYVHFEAIVVNDWPDDREHIDRIVEGMDDRRFRVVHHQHNAGLPAARNSGIGLSRGDIVAFLDDDDLWLPQKLAQHIAVHASDVAVGLVYSGYILRWDDQAWPDLIRYAKAAPADIPAAMRRNRFCPATMGLTTIRRECLARVEGLDESLSQLQDWDLYYRLAATCRFRALPEPLMVFRQHAGNRLTTAFDDRREGLERILNKWNGELTPDIFMKHYPPLATLHHIQKLALAGKRRESLRALQLLRRMRMTPDLARREIPKTLILVLLGPRFSGNLLRVYRRLKLLWERHLVRTGPSC